MALTFSAWVCILFICYYSLIGRSLVSIIFKLKELIYSKEELFHNEAKISQPKDMKINVERAISQDKQFEYHKLVDVYFDDVHLPVPLNSNLQLYYTLGDVVRDITLPLIVYFLTDYSIPQNILCLLVELTFLAADYKYNCKKDKVENLNKRIVRTGFCLYIILNLICHAPSLSEETRQGVLGLIMVILLITLLVIDLLLALVVFTNCIKRLIKFFFCKNTKQNTENNLKSSKLLAQRSSNTVASPQHSLNMAITPKNKLRIIPVGGAPSIGDIDSRGDSSSRLNRLVTRRPSAPNI